MTQYKNVTKKDFVFIIDCIKALEAKIEAGGFPRGQELAEQLSNTMLSLLEAAMGDTEVHNIETWLFYPELVSTVIKVGWQMVRLEPGNFRSTVRLVDGGV